MVLAPPEWDERTQPAAFLDYARDTARTTCDGVSDGDARKAPIPTSPLMTLSGLISHLRRVAYYWFQVMFLGEELAGPLTEASDDDPDREMRLVVEIALQQLLTEYQEQSAGYRRLVSDHDLNATAKRPISDGRTSTSAR